MECLHACFIRLHCLVIFAIRLRILFSLPFDGIFFVSSLLLSKLCVSNVVVIAIATSPTKTR